MDYSTNQFKYLGLLLVAICAITLLVSCQSTELDSIKKNCDNKLKFTSIVEFSSFLGKLNNLNDASREELKKHKSGKMCLDDIGTLNALENLIKGYDKVRPCKFSEVSKLENFAINHLGSNYKSSMARKFFTLFGVNIGYHCKLHLLAHIRQADLEVDQVEFIYAMAAPTGWTTLINEYTKKSMKFGASSHGGSSLINRVAKLIPGMNQIEQLDYIDLEHPPNEVDIKDGVETLMCSAGSKQMAEKLVEVSNQATRACQNLDQFYLNMILSLAKLDRLGLLIQFDHLTGLHEHSLSLHKWLAAASFCQMMARARVCKLPEGQAEDVMKLEILYDDKLLESRRTLYSYEAAFDEISPEAIEKSWQAKLTDPNKLTAGQKVIKLDETIVLSISMRQLQQFIKGLQKDFEELDTDDY